MIRAEIDRQRLERSLRDFARRFGDTSAHAVARWGVQVCREMAFETQPYGTKQVKKKQEGAIFADVYKVIHVIQRIPRGTRNERILHDPQSVCEWMDSNRGEGRRTKSLSPAEKKMATPKTIKQAVKLKMAKAGIAKGGFIGAGMEIAKAQRGADRINIGRNFLSYAHKHAEEFGDAVKPRPGFTPTAILKNKAAHTSLDYVLKRTASAKAIEFGLKKTIKWYASAIRRMN